MTLGVIGSALAVAAWFFLRDPESPKSGAIHPKGGPWFAGLGAFAAYSSYWIVLAQAMIVSIGTWIFMNWLPLYFSETQYAQVSAALIRNGAKQRGRGLMGMERALLKLIRAG